MYKPHPRRPLSDDLVDLAIMLAIVSVICWAAYTLGEIALLTVMR